MKTLLFICATMLLVAIMDLPMGYYTLLRIVVCLGCVGVLVQEVETKPSAWVFIFGGILLLFNPIFPVYLDDKSIWLPIDLISGILFTIKAFNTQNNT